MINRMIKEILDKKQNSKNKMSFSIKFYINTPLDNYITAHISTNRTVQFLEGATGATGANRALFEIENLPLYLESGDNYGVYLGEIYPLKLVVNRKSYFLERLLTGTGKVYYALSDRCTDCVNITILSLNLYWSTSGNRAKLVPKSFISDLFYTPSTNSSSRQLTDEAYFYLYRREIFRSTGNTPIAYSPLNCNDTCSVCQYCPADFMCNNNNLCVTSFSSESPFQAFGLRTQSSIITYTRNGKNAYYASRNQISVDFENTDTSNGTPFLIPQRWFYVDLKPGQGSLRVKEKYPIYIYINSQRYYITISESTLNGFKMSLSENITSRTLSFRPLRKANWGQYVFTNDDFVCYDDNSSCISSFSQTPIALWQNNSLIGEPAVYSIPSPIPIPVPDNPPQVNVFIQALFWISLVSIILIIIFIAIFYTTRRPKEIDFAPYPYPYSYPYYAYT